MVNPHEDQHAAIERTVRRALWLLLPVVASALLLPIALPQLRSWRHRGERTSGDVPTAEEIAAAREADAKVADAERSWRGSEFIAPSTSRTEASTGDAVSAFQGFGISVTAPAGARVVVDGRDIGEAPIVASVTCSPGDEVAVRVEPRNRKAVSRSVRCRADTLVEMASDGIRDGVGRGLVPRR